MPSVAEPSSTHCWAGCRNPEAADDWRAREQVLRHLAPYAGSTTGRHVGRSRYAEECVGGDYRGDRPAVEGRLCALLTAFPGTGKKRVTSTRAGKSMEAARSGPPPRRAIRPEQSTP